MPVLQVTLRYHGSAISSALSGPGGMGSAVSRLDVSELKKLDVGYWQYKELAGQWLTDLNPECSCNSSSPDMQRNFPPIAILIAVKVAQIDVYSHG